MRLYLVHHAEAVGPAVDPQRPLSAAGRVHADALALRAASRGCAPRAIWHSGKLRARQTAEAFLRHCGPSAEFRMVRGLLPGDPPQHAQALVSAEARDVMLVGHMPSLGEVLRLLSPDSAGFPLHGSVALESRDEGATWQEVWRLE